MRGLEFLGLDGRLAFHPHTGIFGMNEKKVTKLFVRLLAAKKRILVEDVARL
jgi:hypothetical protein